MSFYNQSLIKRFHSAGRTSPLVGEWRSQCQPHRALKHLSISVGIFSLGLLLEFGGGLFVFLTDLVEFLHVLEEVRTPLKGDEKLCLFAVASVVGCLNRDGLGSDLCEASVVVSKRQTNMVSGVLKHANDGVSKRAKGAQEAPPAAAAIDGACNARRLGGQSRALNVAVTRPPWPEKTRQNPGYYLPD